MPSDRGPELLRTKLYVPRPREGAVRRHRLLARLDEAWGRSLTLISAPAGSGKTSLVAAWLDGTGSAAAWLSLDREDDDEARFWTYLVEALKSARHDIGQATLQLIGSGARLPTATLASALLNEVAASDDPLLCVLDDLHTIESAELNEAIYYLVANAPDSFHLVATSRADPPWPLARLRATGRMTEIRAADLRFAEAETSELLEQAGLRLTEQDVQALTTRTLGWVAGVQMAAISMRGRDDPSGFIAHFAGSHRFILDYLTEEVLTRQPAEVIAFLERTSVLGRLTGSLCDAVTGESDGQDQLRRLDRDNAFIEALDDERRWYRYHPLLTDVLRTRLRASDPDIIPELHRRASSWFEQQGLTDEAIEHALIAGDHGSATRILHTTATATFMVSHQRRLLGWTDRLPEGVIERDPQLALMRAWARFVIGDLEGIEHALTIAGEAIHVIADVGQRASLDAQLGAIHAWVAYQQGELATCVRLARVSVERLPDDALVPRQTVTAALGAALLLTDELDEAERVLTETRELSRRDHDRLSQSLAQALTGVIALERGFPELARSTSLSAIEVGTVAGEPLPSVGIARVVLGQAQHQAGELAEAARALADGVTLCEAAMGQPEWVYEGLVSLARALLAAGDADEAQRRIRRADGLFETVIRPSGMEPLVRRARRERDRYAAAAGEGTGPSGELPLVEPLNQRELELVRLLAERRSNREIADELYLSVNTVKWHARNLYGKLGVERRRDAVQRARELGIL
jgi:LuxR family maltose regulon positive regulatory protein